MSLYRAGIGYSVPFDDDPTSVEVGADAESMKQWDAENKVLQAELKKATQAFPKEFTARKAKELLYAAVAYGNDKLKKYGGNLFKTLAGAAPDTKGLREAIRIADAQAYKWTGKIPLLSGEGYIYKQNQNKEWAEVRGQYLRVYVEAAGVIGQKIVKDEAVRELANNLNPIAPPNLWRIGIVIATVGITGGYLLSKGHR